MNTVFMAVLWFALAILYECILFSKVPFLHTWINVNNNSKYLKRTTQSLFFVEVVAKLEKMQ